MGSIPGLSSLSDETLNRGPMIIFQDKLLTRTDCDEAGDYVVPNVLSPRDLNSKRIYSANGISRSFLSSHKCFFKTYKNAFKWNVSNWD